MATRNIALEKNAIDTFVKSRGAVPDKTKEDDWSRIYKLAYPTGDLPDELKNTVGASAYAAGFNTPSPVVQNIVTAPVAPVKPPDVNQLYGNVKAAEEGVDQYRSPRTAMNVLQEAIKAKTGFEQASLGESDLFKAAGIDGMNNLGNSLAQRGAELAFTADKFSNVINSMAGQYKDMAEAANAKYKASIDAYNTEATRLSDIEKQTLAHKRELEIITMQDKLAREREAIQNSRVSVADQIKANDAGGTIENGVFRPAGYGLVKIGDRSYDISKYATDPNHERAVQNILTKIGKFNTLEDVDLYLKSKGSPITAQMISKASEESGVGWEELVAMMEQDSSLGTKGIGARNNNPGNIGQFDSLGKTPTEGYKTLQEGVNAVGEWLARNKVATKKTTDGTDLMDQFESVAVGLPSDAVRNANRKKVQEYINNGQTDKAEKFLDSLAHQTLTGKKSESFSNANKVVGEIENAMGKLDAFKATNPGIYRSALESKKGLLNASKNKEWLSFVTQVADLQNSYRNSLFGASLTPGEAAEANRVLINFDADTAGDIEVKLGSLKDLSSRVQRRLLNEERGVFEGSDPTSENKSSKSADSFLEKQGL